MPRSEADSPVTTNEPAICHDSCVMSSVVLRIVDREASVHLKQEIQLQAVVAIAGLNDETVTPARRGGLRRGDRGPHEKRDDRCDRDKAESPKREAQLRR